MSSDFENTPCLVCGSRNDVPYSSKGQFGIPTHVVICQTCGFSYLNPRWTPERYNHFYSVEYDRYYRPEIIGQNDGHYRYRPIQQILERMKERELLSPMNKVLDIGSGMGHALIYLKNNVSKEAVYEAIEPSEHCRAFLEENRINYLSADVYSNWDEKRAGQYDLVIMRHVLEHFHDPLAVLQKARTVLKDDGLLYIGVPDALHPTRPLLQSFFRIVHISYFSKVSLTNLLKKAGLSIVSISEGDSRDAHEVFVFCRKGVPADFTPDAGQYALQKAIYDERRKKDRLYLPKFRLIQLLRKLKILK